MADLPFEAELARKAHVLLAATQLYVARASHDAGEARLFAELFRQLLPDTPAPARRAIAGLLAAYDAPPPGCLDTLAADPDADTAAAALAGSAPLAEATLVAAAARGPERLRETIAGRAELTPAVRLALARHAAAPVLRRLIEDGPPPGETDGLVAALLDRRALLADLAASLARRHALPSRLLFALFLDLDAAGRLEALAAAEAQALADLARRGDPRILTAAFKPAVLASLVGAALAGGAAAFAAHLAYALDLDGETAARIVDDPGGEALMVALKALGTDASDSGRIAVRLLGQRLPLERLRDLLALHAGITPRAAYHLMRGLAAGIDAALAEAAARGRETGSDRARASGPDLRAARPAAGERRLQPPPLAPPGAGRQSAGAEPAVPSGPSGRQRAASSAATSGSR